MEKVNVGEIWKVTGKGMVTEFGENKGSRAVVLNVGEFIEIRYPYEWHYRTDTDEYFCSTEDVLLENCKLHGVVWSNVKSGNRCKLSDIMNLQLYDKV